MSRFQFVWWGLFSRWRWPRVHRWEGGLGLIYEYSLVIGPLEIRRWGTIDDRSATHSVLRAEAGESNG